MFTFGKYSSIYLDHYVRDHLQSIVPLMRKYQDFSVDDISFGPGPDRDEVLRDLLTIFSLAEFIENGLDEAFDEGYKEADPETAYDEGYKEGDRIGQREGYIRGFYEGEKKTLEGIIAALT